MVPNFQLELAAVPLGGHATAKRFVIAYLAHPCSLCAAAPPLQRPRSYQDLPTQHVRLQR